MKISYTPLSNLLEVHLSLRPSHNISQVALPDVQEDGTYALKDLLY
jgi:hypothetical protein